MTYLWHLCCILEHTLQEGWRYSAMLQFFSYWLFQVCWSWYSKRWGVESRLCTYSICCPYSCPMPYLSAWFHLCSCLSCSCGYWSAGGGCQLLWHACKSIQQCFNRVYNLPLLPCCELCDIFVEELLEVTEWDLFSLLLLFFSWPTQRLLLKKSPTWHDSSQSISFFCHTESLFSIFFSHFLQIDVTFNP